MKISRPKIAGIVAAVVLCTGVATVRASEPCVRLIRVYREKLAHHHISKETLERWAVWGKAHPNYHPKPKPTPLTTEESYKKVAFACEVSTTDAMLTPTYIPEVDTTEPLDLISTSLLPTQDEPIFTLVGVPAITPLAVGDADTPEPSSFMLLASGLVFLFFMRRFRRESPEAV